jgi:hypothetical protein
MTPRNHPLNQFYSKLPWYQMAFQRKANGRKASHECLRLVPWPTLVFRHAGIACPHSKPSSMDRELDHNSGSELISQDQWPE